MTLLLVQSWPGANDAVARHLPYWQMSGCDVMGIGTTDGGCRWPAGIPSANIGENGYVKGARLIKRMVETFTLCSKIPNYTDFCVIEYDCLTTCRLPAHPGGFVTHLAGYKSEGFKAQKYWHCPWWADRYTAGLISVIGQSMINEGDIEQGFPDRFIGWLFERYLLPPPQAVRAYSQNTIQECHIKEARMAIRDGVPFIHGVKTAETLQKLVC